MSSSPAPCSVRRARPADAPAMARQMAHPEVYAMLMQLPLPTEELWRARLDGLCKPDSPDMLFVAEIDGELVGSAGLHPQASPRRRHAAHLGISVVPAAQGRGVGRALMQTLCEHADRWLQLQRLELTVFTDNARALALYRRFDFRLEGTHRAYAMRDGRFADVHTMARLHPNPAVAAWAAD